MVCWRGSFLNCLSLTRLSARLKLSPPPALQQGQVDCWPLPCPPVDCEFTVVPEGECCPRCVTDPCQADTIRNDITKTCTDEHNISRFSGSSWIKHGTECTLCQCKVRRRPGRLPQNQQITVSLAQRQAEKNDSESRNSSLRTLNTVVRGITEGCLASSAQVNMSESVDAAVGLQFLTKV